MSCQRIHAQPVAENPSGEAGSGAVSGYPMLISLGSGFWEDRWPGCRALGQGLSSTAVATMSSAPTFSSV